MNPSGYSGRKSHGLQCLAKEFCLPAAFLHLNGNSVMLPSIIGSAWWRKAPAIVCIGMLLVASSVQVMHHCTTLEASTHQLADASLTSSPVFCNVCMTVQVAAVVVIALVLATTTRVRTFAPPLPILFPPEAITVFSLYVRPPPSPSC
jgi:hypothetical protein